MDKNTQSNLNTKSEAFRPKKNKQEEEKNTTINSIF
jgi:hypothetical protein